MYDVTVIGGGVVGGLMLRELTKYSLSVCLLEAGSDVATGQSAANSGIVHAGHDALPGTNKAKFNMLGNRMMPALAEELGVKYKNNGSLVLAFSEEDVKALEALYQRGLQNGVQGMEIIGKDALRAMEPNVSENAVAALHLPTGGIVCPYELTIAAIGNAMDNGGNLLLDFAVTDVTKKGDVFTLTAKDGRRVESRLVINCAGLGSGKIAAMVGDDIPVGGRRGEYILLDRESGGFVTHTLFATPTKKGKGILITPTVDGNILLGPTAEEIEDGSTATTGVGLSTVMAKAKTMCRDIPFYNTITSFAGVRAYSEQHDFIMEESKNAPGLFHLAGIESPGLSAAPAIPAYVMETFVKPRLSPVPNPAFDGRREKDCFFTELSEEEKNEIIARDSAFGKIVCRCEQVTEGEIRRAIRKNPPARTVDAVKRRTRAGMGRCQGGFCQPRVLELIAEELGIPLEEVSKNGGASHLLVGRTK